MTPKTKIFIQLTPVMLTFFAMGFVDLVGIATNYLKIDFSLSDSLANIFTSMVFFWFLIFAVPTGILMNKIGRRKTVLLSLVLTLIAMSIPLIRYNLPLMLICFSILGISNTMMQVSLNPLLSNIVSPQRLSAALTFGQFVKAVAAFLAPIIAAWCVTRFDNWRILFAIFLIEGIIAFVTLSFDNIKEDKEDKTTSGFKDCFKILKDSTILVCFLAIVCHVGIDVGINVSAPRVIMDKLNLTISDAGYATSLYFLFRIIGSLFGAITLSILPTRPFWTTSVTLLGLSLFGLIFFETKSLLYICLALIGFNNANLFPIMFSQAVLHLPTKKNEISGLMIMGICGGAVFLPIMGLASDITASQNGAIAVQLGAVLFLLSIASKVKNTNM